MISSEQKFVIGCGQLYIGLVESKSPDKLCCLHSSVMMLRYCTGVPVWYNNLGNR